MKGNQRKIYLDLINSTSYGLCNICKFAEWEGYCSSEANLNCTHPLEAISQGDYGDHPYNAWSGSDCWGFRPNSTLQEVATFAGIVLEGKLPHWNRKGELLAIIPSERDKEYGFV